METWAWLLLRKRKASGFTIYPTTYEDRVDREASRPPGTPPSRRRTGTPSFARPALGASSSSSKISRILLPGFSGPGSRNLLGLSTRIGLPRSRFGPKQPRRRIAIVEEPALGRYGRLFGTPKNSRPSLQFGEDQASLPSSGVQAPFKLYSGQKKRGE